MSQRLLFVTQVDRGPLAGLQEVAHRVLTPGQPRCSLYRISHSVGAMRPSWQRFMARFPVSCAFVYRDQLWDMHPELTSIPLPAIIWEDDDGWRPLLSAQEITELPFIDGLEKELRKRI